MKAVACLHEAITAMLGLYQELPHFHSNESLCKPFENLLSMQMCDADVQDQVTTLYVHHCCTVLLTML